MFRPVTCVNHVLLQTRKRVFSLFNCCNVDPEYSEEMFCRMGKITSASVWYFYVLRSGGLDLMFSDLAFFMQLQCIINHE